MAKKSAFPWLKWFGYLLLIPSLLFNLYQWFNYQTSDHGIKVLEVLDGDTLLLDGKVRLRLRHVDAPELEYCGGQEAKDLLADLVKNKKVIIQEKILDQKGRPMALVYLNRQLVNLRLIETGWGRFHHDQSSQTEILKAAGLEAKQARIGVYNPDCYQQDVNPDNPNCNIKGNIDLNDSSLKRYYYPGCAQYQFAIVEKDRGEQWFCSEADARAAGYIKAKSCPN